MPYTPPNGDQVELLWSGGTYTAPNGDQVTLEFNPTAGPMYITDASVGDSLVFGNTLVAYRIRTITFTGMFDEVVSSLTATSLRQYLSPSGILETSFGNPTLTSTVLSIYPPSIDSEAYGNADIQLQNRTVVIISITPGDIGTQSIYLGTQHITFTGIDSFVSGFQSVQLFNRTIQLGGIPPESVGTPVAGNQIQVLWPTTMAPPTIPPPDFRGNPTTVSVTSGITPPVQSTGHRVETFLRYIYPESFIGDTPLQTIYPVGFEWILDPDIATTEFAFRMVVANQAGIVVGNIDSYGVGVPSIDNGSKSVNPDSFDAMQFGPMTIAGTNQIIVAGINSEEFGNFKQPTFGLIEPLGIDSFESTYQKVNRRVFANGIDESIIGDTRVGRILNGVTVDSISTFDGPALTNIYGCGNRVIIPVPIDPIM